MDSQVTAALSVPTIPSDLDFLRAQPGFKPCIEDRHRAQRSRLFREYLRNLDEDFGNICAALKVLMVQSQHDRPDLALGPWGLTVVQLRLLCYRYGFGTVDTGGLLACPVKDTSSSR